MSKLQLIFVSLFLAISFSSFSQVGIGTDSPDASAALDITSTTGGFLMPRMTNAERLNISEPALGLQVFVTDIDGGVFMFYDGTEWGTLSFTKINQDANLSDLTVGGSTITGFYANTTSYTVEVANGTTEVPAVTATTTDAGASTIVSAAGSLPGDTTVEVTAANGTTKKTYTVSFSFQVEKPNLPLDFSTTNQLGTTGEGASSSIVKDGDNDVLQIVGANHAWDHAKFEFKDNVDLSDDTQNTITFKIKPVNGTGSGSHFLQFEGGTGDPALAELPFTTTGTDWQTITLDFPAGLGSYPTLVFFVDLGEANAGVSDTYLIDDISIGATVVGTDATLSDLTVGDYFQGGVVFYILQSDDTGYVAGETHGLIAAVQDQSSGIQWYNGSNDATGAIGTAVGTGSTNTDAIISVQGETATSYAAGLARAYNGGGYTDWFLPSKDELNQMYQNKSTINTTALANGGSTFLSESYWSSTEYSSNWAWIQAFNYDSQGYNVKYDQDFVRAVRAF